MEVVNLLLEHRPNVNALDKDGYTALALACKDGYYEIVVALLAAGAYINIQVLEICIGEISPPSGEIERSINKKFKWFRIGLVIPI